MNTRRSKNPFVLSSHVELKHRGKRVAPDWSPEASEQAKTLRSPIIFRRLLIISGICFLALFILQVRVFLLQSNASTYKEMADDNRIRIISQEAPRGIIFDRNNVALTANSPDVGVFVTLDDFPKNEIEQTHTLELLTNYTQVPLEDLQKRLLELKGKSTIQPLPLIEHITHDQAIVVSVHEKDLPGIYLTPRIFRSYPLSVAVSNILGYTGQMTDSEWANLNSNERYVFNDTIGKTGVEQTYEDVLKGQNGKERIEVDAFGRISKIVASQNPTPGENITLSIDSEFQQYLYHEVGKAVSAAHSPGGAAVAQDPRTGEVLALVSWPSYDNNLFSKGMSQDEYTALLTNTQKPLFNKAISGEYPSGSTIKPLIAAAALQDGIINPQTTVLSIGGIQVGQWNFPDWKAGGHGVTNVRKAIAESVNTFFYAVGGGYENIQGLGVDKIRMYAERFGLNKKLGIDIPGEATGFLPTKEWKESTKGEKWYIGDTYHLAIGQGDLLVTPLQINSYISTIANGGTVYQPHVVIREAETTINPIVLQKDVINPASLSVVRQGMRDTVLIGSAKSLQGVPVDVAAKTGTAEFGVDGKTHAWFTAFEPFENPQISLTILIEQGGEGSSTAAPVAKNALTWWADHRL